MFLDQFPACMRHGVRKHEVVQTPFCRDLVVQIGGSPIAPRRRCDGTIATRTFSVQMSRQTVGKHVVLLGALFP